MDDGNLDLYLSHSHGDRWGTTHLGTLYLHLILFSSSLRVSQHLKPVHSKMLFSYCFFCSFLPLPHCTVPCKIFLQALLILILAQTILTCVSSPWLRCHLRSTGLPNSASACIVSDVVSVSSFLSAMQFFSGSPLSMSRFRRRSTAHEITRERLSLIFEQGEPCLSFQVGFSLASAAVVSAILHIYSGLEP